jgi:ribonuclease E
MANNKMLIDASHTEETRVVVVRGNRIEEFDFEAQERRQLRGNIYLAKVTRVEPSLQAAFIDYGGNRHGFLAFSEIHPDYYQIPAADRQALLDAEAAAAFAEEAREDEEIESAGEVTDADEDEDERPAKKSRRKSRRSRSRKAKTDSTDSDGDANGDENDDSEDGNARLANGDPGSDDDNQGSDDSSDDDTDSTGNDDGDGDQDDGDEADDAKKKPRRRRRGRTVAAAMDMDTISEPVDGDEPDNGSDGGDDSQGAGGDDAEASEKEAAPKKKRRARKPAAKKAKAETEATGDNSDEPEAVSEETDADSDGEKPKKTRKAATRRKPAKKSAAKSAKTDETGSDDRDLQGDDGENGDEDGGMNARSAGEPAEKVESVGQEDALEELPVRRARRQYKIQEVIKRRQIMLVQVVKEERGNKGAALTTYLSLAGRYSVLMPNTARGGGISRKITNSADRKRLKEIAGALEVPKGMGVILRTAGASRDKDEINRDFDYLMRLWENVRNLTLESSAPFLVYEEGSLIKRSIRDLYNKDIGEIIVSGEAGYREAKDFMRMLMPSHAKNVKFYNGDQPLLSKFNMETQLDKMVTPQVTLKSGGYLVINQTEALVAIDVNSGRSTREHSIEATALQTNLEAAEEVARQLRLRDLAGLIVIDFIDMEEKRNNRSVERKLKDCLKNDRARIQVGHISHFGLLEMSRQRMRASVLESTMAVCPVCLGVGHVRSESSHALHIVRAIDDHLNRFSRNDVVVKTAPSIALYILNHKREAITNLEERYGVDIAFVSDHSIESQEFTIEKGPEATRMAKTARAVNPMDFEEEDDAAVDSDSTVEESISDEDSESDRNNGRKNRRRRGRGRGRGRDRDDDSTDSGEALPSSDQGAEDDKNDEKSPDTSSKPAIPSATARSAPKPKAIEPDEVSEETRARARRIGRPGKKVRNSEDNGNGEPAASVKPANSETAEKKGAPPRPARARNTRRVAANASKADENAAETAEETVVESVEVEASARETPEQTTANGDVSDAPVVENTEAVSDDNDDATDGKKKKKSSWGFFR